MTVKKVPLSAATMASCRYLAPPNVGKSKRVEAK